MNPLLLGNQIDMDSQTSNGAFYGYQAMLRDGVHAVGVRDQPVHVDMLANSVHPAGFESQATAAKHIDRLEDNVNLVGIGSQPDHSSHLPTPCFAKEKASKATKVRVGNFTTDEDLHLVSSWLNTSFDCVIGTGQTKKHFWLRVKEAYNDNRRGGFSPRQERSLTNRWGLINADVSKFNAYFSQIDDKPKSGTNGEDSLVAAKMMFADLEGSQFKFEKCWLILKHQPKWTLYLKQIKKKNKLDNILHGASGDNAISLEGDDEQTGSSDLKRPIGCKKSKIISKKSNGKGNVNGSSDFDDIFSDFAEQKKKQYLQTTEKSDKNWTDYFNIEKKKLEIAEEKSKAATKAAKAASRAAKASQESAMAATAKIAQGRRESNINVMLMDTTKMNDRQKAYFESLQDEIFPRRM